MGIRWTVSAKRKWVMGILVITQALLPQIVDFSPKTTPLNVILRKKGVFLSIYALKSVKINGKLSMSLKQAKKLNLEEITMNKLYKFHLNVKALEAGGRKRWYGWEVEISNFLGLFLYEANHKGCDAYDEEGNNFEMKMRQGASISLLMSSFTKTKDLAKKAEYLLHMEGVQATFLAARVYEGEVYYRVLTYQEAKANNFKARITVKEIRALNKKESE